MPSYLYHLAFELYSAPPPFFKPKDPFVQPSEIYLPPPGTNIFEETLPTHSTWSWNISSEARKAHKRSKTATANTDLAALNTTTRPAYQRRFSHLNNSSPGDRVNSPVPLRPKTALATHPGVPKLSLDWRFDRICIQSIDMAPLDSDEATQSRSKALGHISNADGLSTKGRFAPADPKNTEVGWGVVHLYRDEKETPGLYDDASSSTGSEAERADPTDQESFKEEDCTTLCILAIPSYMTPADFLGFVGEKTREDVSHFRLIRTGTRNKYMVLMKFREARKAREWRKEWNGKLFNSMEPENCHVVFVKSIQFPTSEPNRDPSNFPNNTNDPFTPAPGFKPTAPLPSTSPVDTQSLASSLTTKPLAPPTPSLVELPTCPVCLERMDETTGLLTILCQHVFHCACLEKWRGTGCPVCRYTQNDALGGRGIANNDDAQENECSVCAATTNLWICLICGNTGCGRYDEAHAFAHYEATSHSYAMDVTTQHVWDYAGDGYVHRLIQNKADGKLVDLPAAYSRNPPTFAQRNANAALTAYGEDTVPREKLDNMGMEYTYLLTSQLESQRSYYEEQLERAVDKASQAASSADEAVRAASVLSAQVKQLQTQHISAQASIAGLEKDVARQTARATASAELARKLTKQYQEEKTMNGALMTRIQFLEEKTKEKEERVGVLEQEKAELAEQNRDLSFFISGGEKLKELQGDVGEEVKDGYVEVPKEEKGKRKGKR